MYSFITQENVYLHVICMLFAVYLIILIVYGVKVFLFNNMSVKHLNIEKPPKHLPERF